jgi:hypothetical protein
MAPPDGSAMLKPNDLLEEVGDIQVIGVAAGQVRLHDGREVDVEA